MQSLYPLCLGTIIQGLVWVMTDLLWWTVFYTRSCLQMQTYYLSHMICCHAIIAAQFCSLVVLADCSEWRETIQKLSERMHSQEHTLQHPGHLCVFYCRGGGELGRRWYYHGQGREKHNTFKVCNDICILCTCMFFFFSSKELHTWL